MSHTEFLPSASKLPWEQPETARVWSKGSCHTQGPRGASCSQQQFVAVAVKCGSENWHCWRSLPWEVVLSGAGGLEGNPPWGLAGPKGFDRATRVGRHVLGAVLGA